VRKAILTAVAMAMAFAVAGSAAAGTLEEVTTKGIVLSVQGMDIDITYTPDGKFTAMEGQVTGTWRIEGPKLCTTSNFEPEEQCVEYPADKTSGDSFEVTGPAGSATIKIK